MTRVDGWLGHYEWPAERVKAVSKKRDDELLRRLKVDFA